MEQMKSTPEQEAVCCCHKKKERDEKEYKDLMNRLSRIEGQVRGVKGMLERDAYCVDILTQVAAINAALNSLTKYFWQITSKAVWWRMCETEMTVSLTSLL